MATLRFLPPDRSSPRHGGEVLACCYSPDQQWVLSGGWDGQLRLWDAATGTQGTAFQASDRPVSACAFAPDGKEWLCGNLDGMLSRWEPRSQRQVSVFLAHARPISALTFSPDGRLVITASWDCSLGLWAGDAQQPGRTLTGHTDIVAGCCLLPDGQQLLSWSHDRTLRLWDLASGCLQTTLAYHADRIVAAAASPDGRYVVSGDRSRVVTLWDFQAGHPVGSVRMRAEVRGCFFLLDGVSLVTAEADGRLILFSVPDLEIRGELSLDALIECGQLARSGAQLALGCKDGRLRLVAVDGFDRTPLLVTPSRQNRPTATPWQRLLGKSGLTSVYLCTCPACRLSFELPAHDAHQQAACPHCQRQLRLSGVTAPDAAAGPAR